MTCDDFALNDVWRLPRSSVKRYYLGSWGWSSCGLYNPTKWARSCDHKSILIFQVIFELGAGHVLSINSQFWFLCTLLHTYFQLTCVHDSALCPHLPLLVKATLALFSCSKTSNSLRSKNLSDFLLSSSTLSAAEVGKGDGVLESKSATSTSRLLLS